MLDKIASFAVEKLLPLLVEVVQQVRGVPKEVEKISEELEKIQHDIDGADRMTATTEQGGKKREVKELREAALRIEDVTEDYMITQQQHRDPGCAAVAYAAPDFIKTMILRLQIAYEIQDIKSSLHEIEERSKRTDYGIQSSLHQGSSSGSQSVPQQHALRMDALCNDEADVVGFEAPKEQLIGWLKKTRAERTVIAAVVGMGGLGKTTLAKTVFDKVIGEFDCHALVTVSQVPDVEELLRDMWKQFCKGRKEPPPEDISQMNQQKLILEVRKYLKEKRYVVFFDDVWKKEFWSSIKSAMIDNNEGSRVLITTRSMEVANFCKTSHPSSVEILDLDPLPYEKSLELFCKRLELKDESDLAKDGLQDISLQILEKCKGLPLAIVAICGVINREEKTPAVFQKLNEALIPKLDENPDVDSITNILGLSYDWLNYNHKPCFLYFGIYPEDYEVECERLTRQWVAEGFVKPKRDQTLEEGAEEYLKELVHRSLVQVSSFSIDGKFKRCRVHDLLHDMILKKIEDLSFCHFVKEDRSMLSGKIRRLQIATKSNNDHLNATSIEGSLIRSLHVFRKEELPEDFVRIIPKKCKRLKVCDFQDNMISDIPENLGNLIHLRYLSFNNATVESLPESIGKLQNLETLDLRETFVRKLPREINRLRNLRHLLGNELEMMEGCGGLESLQTLYSVSAGGWEEKQIKELEELSHLRLLGLDKVEPNCISTLFSSINKMKYLEKLYLRGVRQSQIDLYYISPMPILQKLTIKVGKLERFPEWISKHTKLVKLTLSLSNLTDDPLEALIHLPYLLSLSLKSDAYRGETLQFQNGEFQKLKKLVLQGLMSLKSIHIGEGALLSLKQLVLDEIPELKDVPSGIQYLGKLEVFQIYSMPREFKDEVRQNSWISKNVRRLNI